MTAPSRAALAERLTECVQVFDVCRAHRPLNPEALADAGDWLGNAATDAAAALLAAPDGEDINGEAWAEERDKRIRAEAEVTRLNALLAAPALDRETLAQSIDHWNVVQRIVLTEPEVTQCVDFILARLAGKEADRG